MIMTKYIYIYIYIYIFFNSLLQSLRRDPEKQIMIFYLLLLHWLRRCSDAKYIYCFAVNTTLHCAMIMTKINYLSFQHCFHYTIIMRVKYCFPIATTYVHYTMITTKNELFFLPTLLSLHNCHENKATYYTIIMRKNYSILSGSSLFLKHSNMIQ